MKNHWEIKNWRRKFKSSWGGIQRKGKRVWKGREKSQLTKVIFSKKILNSSCTYSRGESSAEKRRKNNNVTKKVSEDELEVIERNYLNKLRENSMWSKRIFKERNYIQLKKNLMMFTKWSKEDLQEKCKHNKRRNWW